MTIRIIHENCDYTMVFCEKRKKLTKRQKQLINSKVNRIVRSLKSPKGELGKLEIIKTYE